MSTPESERDAQLLAIGHQCSEQSCLLVDFLPFKCQHCSQRFCGEHFTVAAHNCSKYDDSKHNRVAPSCPLCNTPVAIPPGQDPNIRMERHINTECSVMTGKLGKTRSTPVCARGKCGKVLFAPIGCDKCKQQYCPQHRFPKDHSCVSLSTAATSTTSTTRAPPSSLFARSIPKSISKAQTPATTTTKAPPAPSAVQPASRSGTSTNSSQLNGINIFSKTDRSHVFNTASSTTTSFVSTTIIPPNETTSSTTNLSNDPNNTSNQLLALKSILDPLSFKPPAIFANA